MNTYSDQNPPKRGNAKRIYEALSGFGCKVHDLHYNPNLFGSRREDGWGTWACEIRLPDGSFFSGFCGVLGERVFIEQSGAPGNLAIIPTGDS